MPAWHSNFGFSLFLSLSILGQGWHGGHCRVARQRLDCIQEMPNINRVRTRATAWADTANSCRMQEVTFRPVKLGVTGRVLKSCQTRLTLVAQGQGHSCSQRVVWRRWFRLGRQGQRSHQPSFSRFASLHAPSCGLDNGPPPPCLGGWTHLWSHACFAATPLAPAPHGGLAGPGLLCARLQAMPRNTQPTCCSQGTWGLLRPLGPLRSLGSQAQVFRPALSSIG